MDAEQIKSFEYIIEQTQFGNDADYVRFPPNAINRLNNIRDEALSNLVECVMVQELNVGELSDRAQDKAYIGDLTIDVLATYYETEHGNETPSEFFRGKIRRFYAQDKASGRFDE